jgi:hypothetical protein
MSQNNINHIAFVIDASTSMEDIGVSTVVKVFDAQIKRLAQRSKEMNQETRVSVYFFSYATSIHCVIFDKDVLRMPSLAGLYQIGGNTALRDATWKAIVDLKTTSQIYGDHAFLVYALTDGEENNSRLSEDKFSSNLDGLPEEFTVCVFVPDQDGVFNAKKAGFPADNISVWSTTAKGLEEVGQQMDKASDTFFENRSKGIRGSRSLLKIDTSNLSSKKVNDNLDSLKKGEYQILDLKKDGTIRDVCEDITGTTYVKGSGFYQLTKAETIQVYKKVCIRNKRSGLIYTGPNARKLLNLPDQDARLKPEDLSKFDIFVQSTSFNRRLLGGTTLIILKNP